jgi:hypothetical protein
VWSVFEKRGSEVSAISRQTTVEDLAELGASSPFSKQETGFMGKNVMQKGEVKIALKATFVITWIVFSFCFLSGFLDSPVSTEEIIRAPPASFTQKGRLPVYDRQSWNYTELYGSTPFNVDNWIASTSSKDGHNVTTRHADIMDILTKSSDLFKRKFHLWLLAQPVPKGVKIGRGWTLKNRSELLKAPDMDKFKVLTEFIKKSEPVLHEKLLKWMDEVRPKQDRFDEQHASKPESFQLFSTTEWIKINDQMDSIKNDSDDLMELAQTLEPKGEELLIAIAKSFLFNYHDFKNDEGDMVSGFWPWTADCVMEQTELIETEHNLQKKRKLFIDSKTLIKNRWELGVEGEIKSRLQTAFDIPDTIGNMESTLSDTLKALRITKDLPKSIIKRLEEMMQLQFMVIGSKMRFMTWENVGSASGDIAY